MYLWPQRASSRNLVLLTNGVMHYIWYPLHEETLAWLIPERLRNPKAIAAMAGAATLQGNNGDSITLPRYLLWRQSLYHADLCNVLCSRSHSTSYCHTGTNLSKMARNEPCQQGGAQKYSSQVSLRSSHNSDAISVVARDYK